MVGDPREVLDALAGHAWPTGFVVEVDGAVLRAGAAPLGWLDAAVVGGIAVGIPAVVVVLSTTVTGLVAAVLFAAAVLGLGFHRFAGAQRVTVDLAGSSVHVEHANPFLAGLLGLAERAAAFTDVASVEVTRVLTGSRTEPHGRRVSLRLTDDTSVTLAEFGAAATGLVFARAIAALLDAPVRER